MRRVIETSTGLFFLLFSTLNTCADTKPYWVFFSDRGLVDIDKAVAAKIASPFEPKNTSRRARIFGRARIFDETDLPVNPEYLSEVTAISGEMRTVTRFLNGVSVDLNAATLEKVRMLPFVREVKPVMVFARPTQPEPPVEVESYRVEKSTNLRYGNSLEQLNMIGVVKLHQIGFLGSGITIAVLDSGFDNLQHTAFDSTRIIYKHDFIEGDSDPGGDGHGSEVLSVMAALDNGNMIGSAPYAAYMLARTEIVEGNAELRIEEDYWVAGIEWADSLATDIVNSSLGYTTFDDGSGYTYADLDGDTAVTTIVADMAAAKGIVVVTSAGNEGTTDWYYVTTPADGNNVIAVGSMDRDESISTFSSRGPTYDGRIKPDFVALGENIFVTDSSGGNFYKFVNGTSFAAPAVSGAVALILEANPLWSPEDVYEALNDTVIDKGIAGPDSLYGYGLIDAMAASGVEPPPVAISDFRIYDPFPQPITFNQTNRKLYFPMDVPIEGRTLTIKIFAFSGENVQTLETPAFSSGTLRNPGDAPSWDGTNFSGENVAPGVYYYMVRLFGYDSYTGKIVVMR
ncbi:S8 family serine peptidase [Candidatus Latescibacterota bacterium]